MKKSLLFAGGLLVVLSAQEWKVEGGERFKSEHFLKQDTTVGTRALKHTAGKPPCYYKSGIVSEKTCYRQTGNIFVTFGKGSKVDFEAYAKEHHLIFLRLINPLYQTALFRTEAYTGELIKLVNSLNKEDHSIRVRVEWISPRKTR